MHEEHPGTQELGQRLEAYASARLSPDRAAAARIRVAVVEEARMRALETSIGSVPHRHRSRSRPIAAVLLAAGLTLATAVAVAAGSAPGGPLYEARIWLEGAMLPSNANDRALERVRQIEERLLDAERAAASGDPVALAAAIEAYNEAVAEAMAEVGTDIDRLARLEEALGHHVDVLEALSERLPGAAANGINRAIEASQKAVDKLDEAKPHPAATEPAGQPTQKPGKTPGATPTERPERTPRGGPTDPP
ncbi:MAG: hypothetical protein EPO36_03525 [Chloroflexota bacterium]|nr:MAG: hypothetical protein EPO36_03525 [Chloroflexota bacterium]